MSVSVPSLMISGVPPGASLGLSKDPFPRESVKLIV